MNFIHSLKNKISQTFKLSVYAIFFAFIVWGFHPTLLEGRGCDCHFSSDLELGLHLERNFWNAVQKQNIAKLSRKIAQIFQGLRISGIYTREEQITGLTGVTLSTFALNNPIAHCHKDVLVFSYDFVAPVESGLTSGPTLSVWNKVGNAWKLVSHSYVPFLLE